MWDRVPKVVRDGSEARSGWTFGGNVPRVGGREFVREAAAGIVASLVTLAHSLSFCALIFSGPLVSGLGMGLWGFLFATAVASMALGALSSLPPMLAGPRNPAIPVMSALAAGLSSATLAAGGAPDLAVRHVLLGLSLASVLTGIVLWLVGTFRLGQVVRFIPFPVVAGFLGASGVLLVIGGLRVTAGQDVAAFPAMMLSSDALGPTGLRLATAVAIAAGLQVLRQRAGSVALPLAVFGAAVVLDVVLGFAGQDAGWFLAAHMRPVAWSPVMLGSGQPIDWWLIARGLPEMLAVAGVTAMALLLDLSSTEVQRRAAADMDGEFRRNGCVNVGVAALGGLSVGFAPNASRLAEELGARGIWSGIVGGGFIVVIALFGLDLAPIVPLPVLGGLLIYLGGTVLRDILTGQPASQSRLDTALALGIAAVIVWAGYLAGVVIGVAGACMLFAVRYSRVGAIRRHLTRALFASHVERDASAMQRLAAEGHRIAIVWLGGFIFFGTSNGVLEFVQRSVAAAPSDDASGRRWVILDFAGVTGIDTTARVSFSRLADWAAAQNVVLVWSGLDAATRRALEAADVFGNADLVRDTRGDALSLCEEQLLAEVPTLGDPVGAADRFSAWLGAGVGDAEARRLAADYLRKRQLQSGDILCRQGEAADTIEFIATGSVIVRLEARDGRSHVLRRMTRCTVVGEMGFFRRVERGASVVADGPAEVYVLTRERYERMREDDPALAARLLEFILAQLANRMEFANREITSLT